MIVGAVFGYVSEKFAGMLAWDTAPATPKPKRRRRFGASGAIAPSVRLSDVVSRGVATFLFFARP